MIRHVCMFEFLDEAEGRTRAENVAITKAMLEALPEKIEWIRASTVKTNHPSAPAGNWDLILISDFDTMEDLFVNFIGAIVFCSFGFAFLKYGEKRKVANKVVQGLTLKTAPEEDPAAEPDAEETGEEQNE